jgi:hypothetical protein
MGLAFLPTGGRFLFTAPQPAVTWSDALTGRQSISLGAPTYEQILRAEGPILTSEASDEGGNHYYFAERSE